MEQEGILRDVADTLAPRPRTPRVKRRAVDRYAAGVGRDQAHQQVRDRALAGARRSHDRGGPAGRNRQVEVAQHQIRAGLDR